jgi:hypothetical protein
MRKHHLGLLAHAAKNFRAAQNGPNRVPIRAGMGREHEMIPPAEFFQNSL